MADTKISALTDGTTAQSGDLIPIARSGANYYITPSYIGTTLLGSTSLTGATVTTSQPVLNLSQTWNAGAVTFTGLKFNATDTASAAASLLLDIGTGGGTYVSQFSVSKSGTIVLAAGPTFVPNFGGSGRLVIRDASGNNIFYLGQDGNNGVAARYYSFSSNPGALSADLYLTRAAAATLQLGTADAAAPVAQTLQVQSVVSGSPANTAGANFTIKGSAGNGNGAGGSIIFQVAPAGTAGVQTQNTYATALTIDSTKLATFAGNIQTNGYVYFQSTSQYIRNTATFVEVSSYGNTGFSVTNSGYIGISTGPGVNPDVTLYRDAANTLALRNGAAAQTFNVYNSYSSAADYARVSIGFSSTSARIGANAAGTGGVSELHISSAGADAIKFFTTNFGTNTWLMSGSGHFLAGTDNLYDIGASGATRPRNVYVAGSTFVTGSSSTFARLTISSDFLILPSNATPKTLGGLAFIGGAYVGSGSTNNIVFQANTAGAEKVTFSVGAGANDILGIGGGTSSFPALKRSSATLQVRLADDSAYSNLAAAQLYSPPTALTSGATITWNANTSSVASLTLNDVGATLTMSNLVAGGTYLLIITQGTGGSKTITTWTNFKWANGTAPTLSTTAGAIDVISAYSDGTNLYASAQTGFA